MLLNLPLVLGMFDFNGNYPLDRCRISVSVKRQRETSRSCVGFPYFGHLIVVHYLQVTWLDNPKNWLATSLSFVLRETEAQKCSYWYKFMQ